MRTLGKPDIKLKAYQKDTGEALAAALKNGIRRVQDSVAAMSARGNVATNAKARQGVFDAVKEQLERMQEDMTAHLQKLTADVAKDAHNKAISQMSDVRSKKSKTLMTSDLSPLTSYDPARTERYFAFINPGNQQRLAGVFTDRMEDSVLNNLRMGYIAVARQAAVEGWTNAETNRALQEDWHRRSGNNNLYRFVDRSGRAWENAQYFQMQVRTNASRVWQAAFVDTLTENGFKYARIPDSYPTKCDICSAWAGRIIVVAGESKNYPTRDEAEEAGVFHPNCMHTTLEYIDELLDKDELELQKDFPVPNADMDNIEAMNAVKDEMDAERYIREDGMTREQAETQVMRDHLEGELRQGIVGADRASEVVASFSDEEIRAINKEGMPSFQPTKKGEDDGWNHGSAGGIVRYDREAAADQIADILRNEIKKGEEVFDLINREDLKPYVEKIKVEKEIKDDIETKVEGDGTKLKEAIQSARDDIIHEKKEVFVMLDSDGSEVTERHRSGKHGGRIPARFIMEGTEGRTFLHNHPTDFGTGFATSLSVDDVLAASRLKMGSIIACSKRRDYEMRPGKNGWASPAEIQKAYDNARSDVWFELRKRERKGRITEEQGTQLFDHMIWKRVYKQLGMEYIVHRHEKE